MDKSRINPSSDRLKPTKVTGPDKLQQYHKDANSLSKAQEYYRLQEGETSESLNHTVFKGDFTISSEFIKELTDRVNDHINQMDVYINQQHADIKHLENIPQRNLERTNKKLLGQNLRHDFPNGLDQNRQMVDLIEQAKKDSSSLKNATGPVFNEHFLRNFQNIKGSVKQIIDHIEVNNEYIKFLENIEKKTKGLDQNRQMVDLIEQANKDINFLDSVIRRAQLVEKFQRLESKLKKTFEDNKTLKLQKHFLERQLKQSLQENEKLRQDNRDNQERVELKEILKKAKPELSPQVKKAYDKLQDLHDRANHGDNVSNAVHIEAFEELLGHLSPETLKDYKRCGVEFVTNPNVEFPHPVVVKNADDKWQIKLALPYKNGIRGLMLRTIDLLLSTQHQQDGNAPPPERRAEIATRVFRANYMLGEYGFPIQGHEMAKKYHTDFKDGIRKAFKDGRISEDDPREKSTEIGHTYAHDKFLESIKPTQDIPRIFPSMFPGSYFEDNSRWEIFEGQRPVKVGSQEFDAVAEELKTRQQKGENFSLTAIILPDGVEGKEIWVQPYFIFDGLRSRHVMNAKGKHTAWAGEVDIDYETKKVIRLKDQSGHYRTFDKDNPGLITKVALKAFQELGYDTSETIPVLTAIEGGKDLAYKNYKPPTHGNLEDSNWQVPSKQYRDHL